MGIRYALQAAEEATMMLAYEQAADHYARALEVLVRFDPGDRQRRCELLLLVGEAQIRSGERPRAWTTFREAAALASELGDGASLARAAIGASRRYIQPPGVVDEELIGLLQRALEITHPNAAIDPKPLDLVEHRRVSGVAVAAIDGAGRENPKRPRPFAHRPHLDR